MKEMKIRILLLLILGLISYAGFISCEKETSNSNKVVLEPTAAFIVNTTNIEKNDTVFFTDKSINSPRDWTWDFGDGDFSAEQNPFHVYSASGVFNVSLIVKNSVDSDTITKNNFIYVTSPDEPISVSFSADYTTITEGETINFTDLSTNLPTNWTWNFGDGNLSNEQNPSHIYTTSGTSTVELTASNAINTSNLTKTDYITVNEPPMIFPNIQKILLEDFIGHTNGNCPSSNSEMALLINTYNSQLIPINIHFGYFSQTSADYPTDYTTNIGDAIGNEFGVTLTPTGMVNRKGESDKLIDYAAWDAEINSLVSQSPKVGIVIESSINANTLNTNVFVKAFELNNEPLKVQAYIVEDHLFSDQLWYGQDLEHVENYEHRHVLRASINGNWGEDLTSVPFNQDQIIEKNYSFNLDPSWVEENLKLIVIVYNNLSKEIIQVEEQQL